MFATVVPAQHPLRNPSGSRKRKDAFKIPCSSRNIRRFRNFFVIVRGGHLEKVCRRKLLIVSDDNDLTAASDHAESLLGRDLTRFIDYYKVEGYPRGW
jgi:hypothetical protein